MKPGLFLTKGSTKIENKRLKETKILLTGNETRQNKTLRTQNMKHGLADGWQRRRSLIGRWPMTAETGTLGLLPWLVSGLETSGGAEAGADGAETSCWDKSGLRAISGCGSLGARMHAGEVWALAALGTRTGTSRTLATPTQGTSAGAGEGWAWGAHFPWNWYGWRSWHSCDLRMSNKL